jgi:ATP-dependent helicase HrpA
VIPAPIRYPADLPITARRAEIVQAIRDHQVVILAGETGSGKTTQLPKMCLEAMPESQGQIGCTQPRRVAAMSVSKRVAEELNVTWGREVGCKMRFNDDTGRDTRVKFMTDGILLAEIQGDPTLRHYSLIILDEAHERSLNIDFLLGYLKGLLEKRKDLKLIVTSATIDTEAFSQHFGGAPIIEVSGRLYPVDIRYAPIPAAADGDFIEATVSAVEDALIESNEGDVLVFMPTERDIRETCDLLEGRLGSGMEVLGLFGRMPAAEQQRIFSPGRKRASLLRPTSPRRPSPSRASVLSSTPASPASADTIRETAPSVCPSRMSPRAAPISARVVQAACRTACAFACIRWRTTRSARALPCPRFSGQIWPRSSCA